MSYEEFRRRIDTARNILVGAVPSPAGQIDQITYALMYKFMNDIDDQAAAIGGKRSYFINDYEQYNWHKLMSPSLGAHERLELYRQAVQTMVKNPNIPELFRSIYQNAFLPFNSPNVLTMLLKEIDKFSYGEGDDIGDAYEYLLSITGAQGDVGQFRTPRHIIKFIVEAVNPTKDDTVIDPACGTAGFLIAAYNHVRSQHDGKDEQGNANDERHLSSDEWDKIHHNYRGFDIDPTMVRTAKVNMYLHGFKTPDIINHDSLSSEDYWNDKYDVILANPPFMTPKGGIQPHKKFGISANRAEVLFVDYIASHLKPTGRAGIIVPEGVIFQSGKAYKELRKNLVENSLYAVISLPSGVFNPYAGVKTSILLLDKELTKQNDEILFVKVENDGYSLGAQRRKVAGDQFPEALEVIEQFKNGEGLQSELAHAVKRSEIAENADYNLSGDRYKSSIVSAKSDFEFAAIEQIVDTISATVKIKSSEVLDSGRIAVVDQSQKFITGYTNDANAVINDVPVVAFGDHTRAVKFIDFSFAQGADGIKIIKPQDTSALDAKYLYYAMSNMEMPDKGYSRHWTDVKRIKIPLPPIEIQREIVAELDSYQRIIDAAQTIVKTYKPTIKINPDWEITELGQVCDIGSSKRVFESEWMTEGVPFYRAREIVLLAKNGYVDNKLFISEKMYEEYSSKYGAPNPGDIMVTGVGTLGVTYLVIEGDKFYFKDGNIIWLKNFNESTYSKFIERLYTTEFIKGQINARATGGTVGTYTITAAKSTKIPLPPIEVQKQIVAELEAEQKLIDANKQLIETFQAKIKSKIAEVWGE